MTQEQIIEGNKRIAEFMGAVAEQWYPANKELAPEMTGTHMVFPKDKEYPGNEKHHSVSCLKYHTSWEWLMPVVDKIESIGQTHVEFGKKHCRIQPILYNPKKDCMEWHVLHETQCATKIEAVYTAVTSFITWYNQQPK
jgi:hypothetical protein